MAAAVVLVPGALVACDPPPRENGQWPIALAELGPGLAADPGEGAYRRTCIACHGADGKGNGEKTGADFTRPDGRLTKPDDALLASIRGGTRGSIGVMPAHQGLLTDAETTAVLAYVRRTFGPGIAAGSASAVPASSSAPAR
jgi:mono/diheme cytochrome c family protein